jgi:EpsI family protein
MIDRRDVLIGAGCLVAAGGAVAMTPHRQVSLLGGRSLEALTPRAFGGWTSVDTTDLVAPTDPGTFAAKLYDVTVGRVYRRAADGAQIAALLAHGAVQDAYRQLHRPEECYPAYGFGISGDQTLLIPLPAGVTVPGRRMVAHIGDRRENILYWTRLGEYMPTDRKMQQFDRLRTSLSGVIADGVLVRFTVDSSDTAAAMAAMQSFCGAFIAAVAPADRAVLVGTDRAAALQGTPKAV